MDESTQIDNAIRAIREKKPVPEIDFTIHTMEDGTEVSTMERVCKGTVNRSHAPPPAARRGKLLCCCHQLPSYLIPLRPPAAAAADMLPNKRRTGMVYFANCCLPARCPSAGHAKAD